MTSHPKVSIICPLHNKEPYIAETVKSVLAQSLTDWEWIVVENHSTDGGPEQVGSVNDKRVRLLTAPPAVRGPGAARNIGIAEATGDYILFLDADDLIAPDHLETLLRVAEQQSVGIAVSGWKEFRDGNQGNVTLKEPMGRGKDGFVLSDSAIAFAPWAVHCAIIRRSRLTPECFWLTELDSVASEDTAFWFRLLVDNAVGYSQEHSALYRVETANTRNQFNDTRLWFAALKAVTKANLDFLKTRNLEPTVGQSENLMRLWEDISKRAALGNDYSIAKSAAAEAQAWLDNCERLGGVKTWPLRLRKLLGMRTIAEIRNLKRQMQFGKDLESE